MTISTEMRKQVLDQQAPDAFIHLLEIDHPDEAELLRIVNTENTVRYKGEDYTGVAFNYVPAEDAKNTVPGAVLELDNVGLDISTFLNRVDPHKRMECTVRTVSTFGGSFNGSVFEVLQTDEVKEVFFLKTVQIKLVKIQANISYHDIMNNRFPDSMMSTRDFRNLE